MEIFDKIMRELKSQGKTQVELAEYLGVPKSLVSDWKAGRSTTFAKYLPQIAKFLGVSVDYLVENHPDDISPELQDYLEELRTRPEMRMLFSLTKGATVEDVKQAVAIIEALRKKDRKEE